MRNLFATYLPLWFLAGILANVAIQGVEYLNRTLPGPWLSTLRYTLPLIVIGQFGLWYSWKHAPALLIAWLTFTLGNNILRLLMVKYLTGEGFAWWAIVGCAMMVGGAWICKEAIGYNG
jgi:hypothetical protein